MKLVALLAVCALVACQRNATDASVDASADAATPIASASASARPASSAAADLREARVAPLSTRISSIVDFVPGRGADAEHPAGTIFFAAVLDNAAQRGEPTLFEWDVANARALEPAGSLLDRESDKEDNGRATDVRIAAQGNDLYVAVTLQNGRFSVVRQARGSAYVRWPSDFPPARNFSLEVDEHWLALAYERVGTSGGSPELPRSGVALFERFTMKRLATFPLQQASDAGVRYDVLEILDGHLYAAEVSEQKLHVVKLSMPRLQPVKSVDVVVPAGGRRVQLTRSKDNLVALAHDTVVELTPDLEVVQKRELHADEVAIGPKGELLSPVGLDGRGRRGDVVPDLGAAASCTPAWAGAYPLLACSVDKEGIRIARLAPR